MLRHKRSVGNVLSERSALPICRNYLKRLPDFEDLEAEESAMSHALKSSNVHQALAFLVFWRALDKAATLVTKRASELNGDH